MSGTLRAFLILIASLSLPALFCHEGGSLQAQEESPEERFKGEWLVSTTGQEPTSIFVFGDDGKITNTVNNAVGTYEILPGGRFLIVLDDTLILGKYTFAEDQILLESSMASPVQQIDITLTQATTDQKNAAAERYNRFVSSYGDSKDKVRPTGNEKLILNNLRQLAVAGQYHIREKDLSKVGFSELVGPEKGKYIPSMEAVAGESYEELEIFTDTTRLSVTTKDGQIINYDF